MLTITKAVLVVLVAIVATGDGCNIFQYDCIGLNPDCVPLSFQCDTECDCVLCDDESGCSFPACGSGEFQCSNGDCISSSRTCDCFRDCGDGSDEHSGCGLFYCDSGDECIQEGLKCDNVTDCADGSDESDSTCEETEIPLWAWIAAGGGAAALVCLCYTCLCCVYFCNKKKKRPRYDDDDSQGRIPPPIHMQVVTVPYPAYPQPGPGYYPPPGAYHLPGAYPPHGADPPPTYKS